MKSAKSQLIAIVLSAIVARLIVLWLPPQVSIRTKAIDAVSDAREYDALARTLWQDHRFSRDNSPAAGPELFRTPFYPLAIAPGAAFPNGTIIWGLLLQLMLSVLLVISTRQLGLELGADDRQARFAALLVALSPNLAFQATKLISETLFSLLLTITILLLIRTLRADRVTDALATGIASGMLVLTRPIASYLPLVFGLQLLLRLPLRVSALRSTLLLGTGVLLSLLPWGLRNWHQAGYPGISTAALHNLYLYNAATVLAAESRTSLAEARDSMRTIALKRYGSLDSFSEATYWQRLGSVASEVCRQHPLRTVLVQTAGFFTTMLTPLGFQPLLVHCGASGYVSAPPHTMQNTLGLLTAGRIGAAVTLIWRSRVSLLTPIAALLLLLATVHLGVLLWGSLRYLFRRDRIARWLLLPVLYFTALPGPVGEARFRAPIEPLLAILAAVALRPGRSVECTPTADPSEPPVAG